MFQNSNTDIMCNGHRFVKSTLFQSPGYLADLSPYIQAVISSRLFATPIQITANAIKPLAPLAHSILPVRAANFILSGTLTCEYCLHQVSQESFDDGRLCPSLLLERLNIPIYDFVLADQLIEAQEKRQVERAQSRLRVIEDVTTHQQLSESSLVDGASKPPESTTKAVDQKRDSSPSQAEVSTVSPKRRTPSLEESNLYKDDLLIMRICPEIGLHAQAFKCIDCGGEIDLATSRLCHYDGRYYCYSCHTGTDYLPIPARVLRNWDFAPKPVSKSSLQKICFLRTKPVLFNLFQINSMLYGFVDRLVEVKQIREHIHSMLRYLEVCGQVDRPNLAVVPKHFLVGDFLNFFTLNDLFDINQVHHQLSQLQSSLETHIIRKCESCRGKGYYCELCKDPHDILYPFSKNGASCSKCHTVYHKNCFQRKKKNCTRCVRINLKKKSLADTSDNMDSDVSLD